MTSSGFTEDCVEKKKYYNYFGWPSTGLSYTGKELVGEACCPSMSELKITLIIREGRHDV